VAANEGAVEASAVALSPYMEGVALDAVAGGSDVEAEAGEADAGETDGDAGEADGDLVALDASAAAAIGLPSNPMGP